MFPLRRFSSAPTTLLLVFQSNRIKSILSRTICSPSPRCLSPLSKPSVASLSSPSHVPPTAAAAAAAAPPAPQPRRSVAASHPPALDDPTTLSLPSRSLSARFPLPCFFTDPFLFFVCFEYKFFILISSYI